MRTPLSISLLLVALLGCSRSTAPVITTPNATQIAEFTANAKITLPASAQPVGWREERGMDAALWLQLRMPKTELQSFLDGSPFRSATLNTNDQSLVFKFRDFFRRRQFTIVSGAGVTKRPFPEHFDHRRERHHECVGVFDVA